MRHNVCLCVGRCPSPPRERKYTEIRLHKLKYWLQVVLHKLNTVVTE